jgi:hypothetical protein
MGHCHLPRLGQLHRDSKVGACACGQKLIQLLSKPRGLFMCRVACCHSLESAVMAFKLDRCWKEAGWRPLLNGKQVMITVLT